MGSRHGQGGQRRKRRRSPVNTAAAAAAEGHPLHPGPPLGLLQAAQAAQQGVQARREALEKAASARGARLLLWLPHVFGGRAHVPQGPAGRTARLTAAGTRVLSKLQGVPRCRGYWIAKQATAVCLCSGGEVSGRLKMPRQLGHPSLPCSQPPAGCITFNAYLEQLRRRPGRQKLPQPFAQRPTAPQQGRAPPALRQTCRLVRLAACSSAQLRVGPASARRRHSPPADGAHCGVHPQVTLRCVALAHRTQQREQEKEA